MVPPDPRLDEAWTISPPARVPAHGWHCPPVIVMGWLAAVMIDDKKAHTPAQVMQHPTARHECRRFSAYRCSHGTTPCRPNHAPQTRLAPGSPARSAFHRPHGRRQPSPCPSHSPGQPPPAKCCHTPAAPKTYGQPTWSRAHAVSCFALVTRSSFLITRASYSVPATLLTCVVLTYK